MQRFLLNIIITIIGVKIFRFNGNRDDIRIIRNHKVMTVNNHAIVFNFYEKLQSNIVVRFCRLQKSVYKFYIVEATFSDAFPEDLKFYNNKKYYIDFKMHNWFNDEAVLDVLLEKFIKYLTLTKVD